MHQEVDPYTELYLSTLKELDKARAKLVLAEDSTNWYDLVRQLEHIAEKINTTVFGWRYDTE